MTATGFEHAAAALLAVLTDSAIRAVLFAVIVGGALAAFRVNRPAVRLWAWTIVLWAALAMPALGRMMPVWRVQVPGLPSAWLAPTPQDEGHRSSDVDVQAPTSTALPLVALREARPALRGLAAEASKSDSTTARANRPTRWSSLPLIAVGLYLIGLIALAFRASLGWIAMRRLERAACPVDDTDATARLDQIASAAGLRHSPRLLQSAQLLVPMTMSVTRPAVVLTDTWRSWNSAMLEAVLTHEVSHVARLDTLTQRLSLLCRAIYWFNPLAWWLPRQLGELAEQTSDEAVLSAGTSHTQYARMLLEFFRAVPPTGHRAGWDVAMARGAAAHAEVRIERVLAWKGENTVRTTRWLLLGIVLTVAPGVALVAAVKPTAIGADRTALPQARAAPVAVAPVATSQPVGVASGGIAAPPAPVNQARRSDLPTATTPALQTQNGAGAEIAHAVIHEGFGAGAYRPGSGVTWPEVKFEGKPVYTDGAARARVEGVVELEAVVLADGTVGPVRITKSLDALYGLDYEAIRATRQWVFQPAQLKGQPVSAVVGIILEFKLADSTAPSAATLPRPLADEFAMGAYLASRHGVVAPRLTTEVMPRSTPVEMRAKIERPIEGQLDIEVIVMPDGSVGKARVVRSLGQRSEFDESALTAAKKWRFYPGTLEGNPVPVLLTISFEFKAGRVKGLVWY